MSDSPDDLDQIERRLLDELRLLQQEYYKRAAPIADRLTEIARLRPPSPVLLAIVQLSPEEIEKLKKGTH